MLRSQSLILTLNGTGRTRVTPICLCGHGPGLTRSPRERRASGLGRHCDWWQRVRRCCCFPLPQLLQYALVSACDLSGLARRRESGDRLLRGRQHHGSWRRRDPWSARCDRSSQEGQYITHYVLPGWGEYLQGFLSVKVVNEAILSRSARSYTLQGHFDTIIAQVVRGDFVIMEFGHNDKGTPSPTDRGKPDCPGSGSETCTTTYK